MVAFAGEIAIATLDGTPITTAAYPVCVRSNKDVAITEITAGLGGVSGAV